MSSITAFESEIKMQIEFLQNFRPLKPLTNSEQKRTVFCGTGDSFAVAQIAQVFSGYKVKSLDPLELPETNSTFDSHNIYLISISGNTISNVRVAKRYRNTTAITANDSSRLARACHKVIHIKFNNAGIQTAGSISFLANLLTCISLVTKVKLGNYLKIYKLASKEAKKQVKGRIYILGNLYSYPIAMFCAAKLYEVLGADVRYERIEEFSHMELFSSRKGDTVIIFEKKNAYNQKLIKNLKKCGLHTIRMNPQTDDPLMQILFFIFVSEFLSLHLAKKENKRDCFFVEAKKLRNASSSMIY